MSVALAGLFFTACTEDYTDWAGQPAQYTAENSITIPGFTASALDAVDLKNIDEAASLLTLSEAALPEGFDIQNIRIIVTPTEDVKGNWPLEISAMPDGLFSKADLQALVERAYNKRPVNRVFNAHVYADAVKNGQAVLIDAGTIQINITPEAPVIEQAYYFTGSLNNWDNKDTTYKLTNDGSDPYENPVYTCMIPATEDGSDIKFKMTPESGLGGDWGGCLTSGDEEGYFNYNNAGGDLVVKAVEGADFYELRFHMLDMTWTANPITLSAQYYVVGAAQGWNASKESGMTCMFTPESKTRVSFTTKWTGDHNLKIWSYDTFGNWDAAYGALTDGDSSMKGGLTNSGAGAIVCPEGDAVYTITLDFSSLTYEWTKLDNQNPTEYEHISLIGEFNGWDGDFELTQSAPHNWHAVFTQKTDGQLKFRANHDWSTNWGYGNDKDWNVSLSMYQQGANGAGNIFVPAGEYDVYLNDITGAMIFVKR